jgi:hypothetical protein
LCHWHPASSFRIEIRLHPQQGDEKSELAVKKNVSAAVASDLCKGGPNVMREIVDHKKEKTKRITWSCSARVAISETAVQDPFGP